MSKKEKKVKLSIIVPAYKVEAYIKKCILSLEDQDLPKEEYEIIVINDGSPDHCKIIIENLQKKYSNIVLINQENQGVSMARNNGISIARGEYILPIDPDDYVLPQTLGRLIRRAENQDLDVFYLGFEIFDVIGKSIWHTDYNIQDKNIYNGVEAYFASRGKDVKDPDRSWAILYKNVILKKFGIKYPKDVPYLEDGLFLAKVFAVAQKVGFSKDKFYQRTTRLGSATNSKLFYSDNAVHGFIMAAKDLREFVSRQSLNIDQMGLVNHGIVKFVILPLSAALSEKKIRRFFFIVKRLRYEGFNRLNTNGVSQPYLQLADQYNRSPYYLAFNELKRIFRKQFIRKHEIGN